MNYFGFEIMSGIKCFIFIAILLSIFVNESMTQKEGSEQVDKAPKLKPNQLMFAKGWWRKLGEEQKKPLTRMKKKSKLKPAVRKPKGKGVKTRASAPGGDHQFLDSQVSIFFPVGDRFGGVPDDIIAMGSYCIQFVINGIIAIAYTTVRWPHKILVKTMVGVAVLTFIPTNGLFCLNPLSILNFVKKGAIVNKKADALAEVHEEFKKRVANSIDRIDTMIKMQKHTCCAWFDFKQKLINTVDKEAKDFIAQWMTAFFKIHEIIYCMTFTKKQATEWCSDFEYFDDPPMRVLPRSWITIILELFSRFI